MKKILIILSFVLLFVIGGLIGFQVGKSQKQKVKEKEIQEIKKQKELIITKDEKETIEKIAKLSFNIEKEALKNKEMSEEQKSEIARNLVADKSLTEVTGTEMLNEFKKYYGDDSQVTFDNIKCGIDHGSEEQNYYLIFDKEQDKYVYNDKHPGHGGGGTTYYGFEMDEESTTIKDKEYIYNVKVLFYGPALDHDVGSSDYGNGYKTYKDAIEEANMLVQIDGNKTYWQELYDGLSVLKMDEIMKNYKQNLDTYSFIFEKEGTNLIFKEYHKK